MREPIAGQAQSGASGVRALLRRADAVVHAAQDFQGSAEPLAPDGLFRQGELEQAIKDYRRVRHLLD
jgi:hypothetical protein